MVVEVVSNLPGERYVQFGKDVLMTQMRFFTLQALFEVDQDVQRKLDTKKRAEIRDFILESLKSGQPFFFSPFVFSSRRQIAAGNDGELRLNAGSRLYILDGQHRCSALASALGHLKSMQEANEETGDLAEAAVIGGYIDQLNRLPIALQIFLDLTTSEEKQLFSDINSERSEPRQGLRMQYDQRDPYTTLARQLAEDLSDDMDIEMVCSRLTAQNSAITSLTTMRRCLVALFEGSASEKKRKSAFGGYPEEEAARIGREFFASWLRIYPKKMPQRGNFVCAKTGIQIALAQTAYQLVKGEGISYDEAIDRMTLLRGSCTWKAGDPLFAHMYEAAGKRLKNHGTTTNTRRTMRGFLAVIERERALVLC
ncbi:DNA sulfur modification protein DndB [Sporosarcina trichiuri]|uniref:DNA sulfur modification protein DndB n=1 Tax=Sporosarcina trichiuri TaxID=3056445 RepID=UPI0025B5EB01|nr:DNA sulfur modification protein DndB [Sporosarcina sp. 0.2-SM1T-5]WJY26383.1 DNA sulfur modification protein DndB [Sporosarcina sp. 0.2-SM1T-5]